MKRALAAAVLVGAALGAAAAAPPPRHVVIISVDGLRPDAIGPASAPRIAALAAAGRSTAAQAAQPPETLPNHVSMATGLAPATHGITGNAELRAALAWPTVFTAVHAAGGRTGLYYGKAKLAALAPGGSADVERGPGPGESRWHDGAGATLAARFAADFPRERYALAWVHLREPDLAGHKAGWMSEDYLAAVREADAAVGVIVDALAAGGLPATVILTADHGGDGTEHWGRHAPDWQVPWICAGPGVTPGALGDRVSTLDVAPTALAVLGLPPLPGSEGRPLSACVAR